MAFSVLSIPKRIHKTLASLRTGVVLLILVGLASALGTFILQRPATDPEKLTRSYSAATLHWLDRFGLTDVFHAWWFLTLLGLVSLSIILVSIDRFPNAWRFYARPYRKTDSHFRAAASHENRVAHQQHRRWSECSRAGTEEVRLAGRTHCRPQRTLLIFRTSSLLRHGGVHRPRQPASYLCRWHHRWSLWL